MAEWVLGGLASSLYMYNRENFMFDKTLRLKREFQGQGMRIKQFSLYREDVRDLMNLTISKMDNYLVVNALQLGFCIVILTEGRPNLSESPPWLLWLWSMSTMGAFFYFLLSAWLAIHASIAAHSFGVRMLTQFVRLPVPNQAQLDAARAHASDFEGLSTRELLRIPVVKQQFRRLNAAMDNLTSQDADTESEAGSRMESETATDFEIRRNPMGLPQHTRLYRELQANWQAYDAYARVCMALGTNQMMYALGYDVLQMLVLLELSPEPALACLIVCAASAWLLARLDLYLSRRLLTLAGVLLVVPPVLSLVSLMIVESGARRPLRFLGDVLILCVFAMHLVWLVFIVYIAKADSFGSLSLPRNFRSVLYLDVFGQMEATPAQAVSPSPVLDSSTIAAASSCEPQGMSVGGLAPVAEDPPSLTSSAQDRVLMQRQESFGSFARQRSSSAGSIAGLAMRPELRNELAGLCRRLQAELQRDLLRWEGAQLPTLVGPDGYEVAEVARLRADASAMAERLEALAPGGGASASSGEGSQGGASSRAWLKLEWNPSGNPTEFWYCCDSGDVAWIRPREPNVILELGDLQTQLNTLAGKVEALAELQPEELPEVAPLPVLQPEPRQSPPAGRQPEPSQRSTAAPSTGSTPALSAGTHQRSVASSSRSVAFGTAEAQDDDESPAQVHNFGGQEALQGEALRNAFALNSVAAANTFHPHRQSAHGQECLLEERRRPPGQLPWLTFLKGSLTLIAVWAMGFLWIFCRAVLRIDIPVAPPLPPDPELRLVAEGPHSFFSSTGLACQEGTRSVFITEKYAVHELPLDMASGLDKDAFSVEAAEFDIGVGRNSSAQAKLAALRPALAECLAQAPDFHGAGLRGIALECAGAEDTDPSVGPPGRRCAALLLGAGGHGMLRCALVSEVGGAASSRVAAFGGPWRGFVPSRGGEAIWAERERDGAIVMLQRSFGTDNMLVPQFEVPLRLVHGPTSFHVLEDSGMVLGLQSDGLLRAWPLAGSGSETGGAWSRHLGGGRRWLGLCSVGEALFLLAAPDVPVGAAPEPAAVWHLPLPRRLRRLQGAAA